MLQSLVYMSSAAEPFDDDALEGVLEHARSRNTADGLTGLLVHRNGRFMQLLEGPYDAVLSTYQRILADDRHDDVRLLAEESIHTRRFPEWSMAYDRDTDGAAVPEGFSDFLETGDRSADSSRSRELLRWFRNHPMADPMAAKGKHRRDA
ncbi:Sensors of blue-light using FAD [Curtobacterium sp. 314Chir4.1]|uniref:BLUF domain-containing protein n=1 Tax=Curtobacterium sp. 314Chir4.1 TaxID=1279028 RepID=UPI000BC70B3C|nr:BLUF domain-containing protein [Curtobacterium sp. 314Chir4.1]SOC87289.1 Sensors of blue-light using FAD [Curtobacterium sp. 314Chir4.1]